MWFMALTAGCEKDLEVEPWTVWPDEDGDGFGYGAPEDGREVTADVPGWVANRMDCEDGDPRVNPDATDICPGDGSMPVDLDCSGWADPEDGSVECSAEFTYCPFYTDEDGDSYGGLEVATFGYRSCYFPENMEGLVQEPGDCDDGDPLVHPYATETCDTIDNNCDDAVDEGC